jgi:hypothetical protein
VTSVTAIQNPRRRYRWFRGMGFIGVVPDPDDLPPGHKGSRRSDAEGDRRPIRNRPLQPAILPQSQESQSQA